jgi:hypothetical protein
MFQKGVVLSKLFFLVKRPDIHAGTRSAFYDEAVMAFSSDESIRPFAGTLQVIGALGNLRHSHVLYDFLFDVANQFPLLYLVGHYAERNFH